RTITESWLIRQLKPVLNQASGPVYGLTTIPIVAGLIGRLNVKRWVYYCVDDFANWPGLDGSAIRELEDQLFEHCDEVIAASEVLRQRALQNGKDALLLTHGVDLRHWSHVNPAVSSPIDWP